MSITKAIRDFMIMCPFLEKSSKVNVDFLGVDATEYSIDRLPCDPVIRRYTDGSTIRQFQFAFTSVQEYSANAIDNIANNDFYEKLEDWIEQQNELENLPKLQNASSIELQINTSGYLFSNESETARYQIQLNLIYRRS